MSDKKPANLFNVTSENGRVKIEWRHGTKSMTLYADKVYTENYIEDKEKGA